jgi:hypothetical protein
MPLAGPEAVPALSVQLSVVTLTMTSSYAPVVLSVTPTVIEAGLLIVPCSVHW